jgi:ABC-type cobalamin/Fe3+-siderophores transport system ATPase subunit
VATHDLNQAAAYFSTVLLLNRRVIALGAPADVLTAALLRQAYGSQLHVVHSAEGDLVVADSCCGGGTLPPAGYGAAGLAADEVAHPALLEQHSL